MRAKAWTEQIGERWRSEQEPWCEFKTLQRQAVRTFEPGLTN